MYILVRTVNLGKSISHLYRLFKKIANDIKEIAIDLKEIKEFMETQKANNAMEETIRKQQYDMLIHKYIDSTDRRDDNDEWINMDSEDFEDLLAQPNKE